MGKLFSYISSEKLGYIDLEADSLKLLAQLLPEDWRGTARAYDEKGKLKGFIGRKSDGESWHREFLSNFDED